MEGNEGNKCRQGKKVRREEKREGGREGGKDVHVVLAGGRCSGRWLLGPFFWPLHIPRQPRVGRKEGGREGGREEME